jgi:hypothetical protein
MKALRVSDVMIIGLACTAVAAPARAQEAAAAPPAKRAAPAVQVTPFISIDSRGSSPVGAAISFPAGSNFRIETELGYRRGEGDLRALSSSGNVLYALPRLGRTTPYLATGAGLASYGIPVTSARGSVIGTEPRIAFEVNAGGGVKVAAANTWEMRTDARWFKSFGRTGSEHWRVSQGLSFDVRK